MEYILRKANDKDAGRIDELFAEMLNTIYCRVDSEGYEEGYLKKFFTGGEDWICVAEAGEKVVGFLSIEVHREGGFIYLDDFSVTADSRDQGIGSDLLVAAETFAKEIGIPEIVLHVDKQNPGAYRFYKRHGYIQSDDEEIRIRMSKPIE